MTPTTLGEALALIAGRFAAVTGPEPVSLDDARGRILAEAVVAPLAVPAADNAAVDGYAFAFRPHMEAAGARLKLIGRAAAGRPFVGEVGPGEAVRILTGAVMPAGTDTVAMQEDVRAEEGMVDIPAGLHRGANRREAGEDIAPGSRLFAAGRRLRPADIGMLASLGFDSVAVHRKLKVAVLSCGDELAAAGQPRQAGQVYDANRPVLLALLRDLGMAPVDLGIVPDREAAVRAALAEAAGGHDAVLSSAGMSAGDEDHVKSAVLSLGSLDIAGLALKPGRAVSLGQVGGVPFFGLPGNPVAALVTFLLVVRPALLLLAGCRDAPPSPRPVFADFSARKKRGRRDFLRCTLHPAQDGRLLARRSARDGSGILSAIAECDGLLDVAEDIAEIVPGMRLPFLFFAEYGL